MRAPRKRLSELSPEAQKRLREQNAVRSAKWLAKNLELRKEYMRQYRPTWKAENPEYSKDWYLENKVEHLKKHQKWYVRNRKGTLENKIPMLLDAARWRARGKGLEFSVTSEDIERTDVCPLLGITLNYNNAKLSDNSPSLDRIDSTKGYVKGNVWVVSGRANRIKSNATHEELTQIAKGLKRKLKALS